MSSSTPSNQHTIIRFNPRATAIIIAIVIIVMTVVVGAGVYYARAGAENWLAEAKRLSEANRWDMALSCLDQALKRDPRNIEALELKSKLLTDLSRALPELVPAARQAVEDALLAGTEASAIKKEIREQAIRLNLESGQFAIALAHARASLQTEPNSAEAFFFLGLALEATKADVKEIRDAYEQTLRLDPGHINGAIGLARWMLEANDSQGAKRVLDGMLKATKEPIKARTDRYRLWSSAGAGYEQQAQEELNQAVKQFPQDKNLLLLAVGNALDRSDRVQAQEYLKTLDKLIVKPNVDDKGEQTLAQISEWTNYSLLLGRLAIENQDYTAAIRAWQEGLQVCQGRHRELNFQLAQLLLALGRVADASPLIAQHHRLTWDPETTRPSLDNILLQGHAKLRSNQAEQAAELLEPIRNSAPSSIKAQVLKTLAQTREQLGQKRQAVEVCRQAVENAPQRVDLWRMLARLIFDDNPNEAVRELERALLKNPSHPELLGDLTKALTKQRERAAKDPQELAAIDQKISQLQESSATTDEAVIALIMAQARILESDRKQDQAETLLSNSVKTHPKAVELWSLLALTQARGQKVAEAIQTLDRGVKAVGDRSALRIQRARILTSAGKPRQVIKQALTRNLNVLTNPEQIAVWMAVADLSLGDWNDPADAKSALEEWVKLAPTDLTPRLNLMNLAVNARDFSALRRLASEIEAIDRNGFYPKLAKYWEVSLSGRDSASLADRKQKLEDGLVVLKEIIAANEQQPMGPFLAGQTLDRLERYEEAEVQLKRAVELNAGAQAVTELARLLAKRGRIASLDELAKAHPAQEAAIRMLAAQAALKANDLKQAREQADLAVRAAPESYSTRLWQAELLSTKFNDAQAAEQSLETLVEKRAEESAAWLSLIQFLVGRGEMDKAKAKISDMLKQAKPDSLELLEAQAWVLVRDRVKAEERFRSALKAQPNSRVVADESIKFFQAVGKIDEAIAVMRKQMGSEPRSQDKRRLALLLIQKRFDQESWQEAKQLLQSLAGGDFEDRLALAEVLLNGPNPQDQSTGLALLETLASNRPDDARVRRSLAQIYSDNGRLEAALPHARTFAALGGSGSESFLASVLLRLHRASEARSWVEQAVKIAPNDMATIELQARLFEEDKQKEKAAELLKNHLNQQFSEPEKGDARISLSLLTLLARVVNAQELVNEANRIAKKWPETASSCALVLESAGKLDQAVMLCRTTAASLDLKAPETKAILTELAKTVTHFAVKPDSQAALVQVASDLASRARALDPQAADLILAEAAIRHRQARYQDELKLYEQLLNTKPPIINIVFVNNMAWTLSEHVNRPEEGLTRINQAIQTLGAKPALLDTKGVILTRLKRYSEAVPILEEAVRSGSKGSSLYHLARAYYYSKNTNRFRETLEQARKTGLRETDLQPNEREEFAKLLSAAGLASSW